MMTAEIEQHIEKFINEFLSKVIRPSNSTYYSQVHLVPKPSNESTDSKIATCVPRKGQMTTDY